MPTCFRSRKAARQIAKKKTQMKKLLTSSLEIYNDCIYLQARKFKDRHLVDTEAQRAPCNCSSFREKKILDIYQAHGQSLNTYHQDNLSRVYPSMQSRNVKPMANWLHGVQLVALNYQNIDEGMLLNEGIFRNQNGGSGYVLKPPAVNGPARLCKNGHRMLSTKRVPTGWVCACQGSEARPEKSFTNTRSMSEDHDSIWRCKECDFTLCEACASEQASLRPGDHVETPVVLRLRLISGHHLPRPQKEAAAVTTSVGSLLFGNMFDDGSTNPVSPYTHVKIHGVDADNAKQTSRVQTANGFDPVWDETFEFNISRPDVAILTLQVYDQVSKSFVVAAAYPVSMLREGIRWVPMWDYRLRTLEHCGLLVEIRIIRGDEDKKIPTQMAPSAGTGSAEGGEETPLSAGTGGAEGVEVQFDHSRDLIIDDSVPEEIGSHQLPTLCRTAGGDLRISDLEEIVPSERSKSRDVRLPPATSTLIPKRRFSL